MRGITNYGYLFQSMFGIGSKGSGKINAIGNFKLSDLNSSAVQQKLKSMGIDTNSKQYKAVIKQMMDSGANGNMYANINAIRNLMKNYDKNGDYICPITGLTGLLVTDEK